MTILFYHSGTDAADALKEARSLRLRGNVVQMRARFSGVEPCDKVITSEAEILAAYEAAGVPVSAPGASFAFVARHRGRGRYDVVEDGLKERVSDGLVSRQEAAALAALMNGDARE